MSRTEDTEMRKPIVTYDVDHRDALFRGRIGAKRNPQWTGPGRTNNIAALEDARAEAARREAATA
jgi:hypothetical protein